MVLGGVCGGQKREGQNVKYQTNKDKYQLAPMLPVKVNVLSKCDIQGLDNMYLVLF